MIRHVKHMNREVWRLDRFLPAARVLVQVRASEALVSSPGPEDPPGLLGTVDLDPS